MALKILGPARFYRRYQSLDRLGVGGFDRAHLLSEELDLRGAEPQEWLAVGELGEVGTNGAGLEKQGGSVWVVEV